jgi:hypothetical protein
MNYSDIIKSNINNWSIAFHNGYLATPFRPHNPDYNSLIHITGTSS